MKTIFRGVVLPAVATSLALACSSASSEVIGTVVKLGQTADLSGSRAPNTKEFNAGALAYFAAVNKGGGVYGRRIELKSLDDAYKIERSVANARELIEKDAVFSIFATVGTENFKAVEQLSTPAGIPLFAPSTGAEVIRAPYKRYVFPVRAGYHAEMEKIIGHLATIGLTRVAVLYDDDSFGKDILVGVERSLASRNMQWNVAVAVDREGKNVADAATKIGKTNPQAVIVGSAGGTAVKFAREMVRLGHQVPLYMNSGLNAGTLSKELGDKARGTAVVQLMPSLAEGTAVAIEYRRVADATPGTPLTVKGLEGYVAARIFVEGLKRAGKDLTREKFVQALESLNDYDVGGMRVNYSSSAHAGLAYVDLAVISRDGKLKK